MSGSTAVEGYTVVLCAAPGCRAPVTAALAAALRICVRGGQHGVLVGAGCSVGPLGCRIRPAGPLLLVQPCDADRRPTRVASRIGPIRDGDDVVAVCGWLAGARLDPALLPPHLVAVDRLIRGGATN